MQENGSAGGSVFGTKPLAIGAVGKLMMRRDASTSWLEGDEACVLKPIARATRPVSGSPLRWIAIGGEV
jgi:hypothetical protein